MCVCVLFYSTFRCLNCLLVNDGEANEKRTIHSLISRRRHLFYSRGRWNHHLFDTIKLQAVCLVVTVAIGVVVVGCACCHRSTVANGDLSAVILSCWPVKVIHFRASLKLHTNKHQHLSEPLLLESWKMADHCENCKSNINIHTYIYKEFIFIAAFTHVTIITTIHKSFRVCICSTLSIRWRFDKFVNKFCA